MKAAFKGKYDTDKLGSAVATFSVKAGDVRLRASVTDATIIKGPSLDGLALAVEKPGSFIIEYDVPKKDVKFQYMNSIRVAEKPLKLTYIHTRGANRTILDGSLEIDPANKVSANYMLGTENCKLKYTYVHNGITTLEPAYDYGKNAWDFAVSRKVYEGDVLRATYHTSNSVLGLEWSRDSKLHGSFKISATCNLAEEVKVPKITAESSWEFEM